MPAAEQSNSKRAKFPFRTSERRCMQSSGHLNTKSKLEIGIGWKPVYRELAATHPMSHPPLHSCTRAQRHTHRRPEPSAPRFFFSLSFNWVISIHLSSNSLIFLQSIVCPDDFSFLFNLLSSRISIKFFPVYIFLLKFSTASSVKLHCPLCEYIFRSHFKVFVTGNMHYLRFDFC